jgi:hypothetical protein
MSEHDAFDEMDRQPRSSRRRDLLSHYGINQTPANGPAGQLKKLEPLDIGKYHTLIFRQ